MTRVATRAAKPAAAAALIVAEPPAHWQARPLLVVDCSLLAVALFQEDERESAEGRMAGRDLQAPTILDYEIVSVALKKGRQKGSSVAQAGMSLYAALSIELHAADPDALHALAQHYELSAYDAAYLWLAAELKAPLATFDRKLGAAAQRHLGALE